MNDTKLLAKTSELLKQTLDASGELHADAELAATIISVVEKEERIQMQWIVKYARLHAQVVVASAVYPALKEILAGG